LAFVEVEKMASMVGIADNNPKHHPLSRSLNILCNGDKDALIKFTAKSADGLTIFNSVSASVN
jgi:hypothetical protein